MALFDVTVVMHFKSEGDTYDEARGRAVQHVLDRLNEDNVDSRDDSNDSFEAVEESNGAITTVQSRKHLDKQIEYQRRYNERVSRVDCPRCGAEAGNKCWNLHALKRGVKERSDTTHGERQAAHRIVYPNANTRAGKIVEGE